ncbi:methyltransferase domain-containing protein [Rhizosphaericola mali]|uniref:Methyltransferase domain-containing protein n=1 Tax=Rhizosphaericola mali TaxID=2545455 RepID=A0A5P2FY58_9BACT|nr:methyltransferase domain-containing protein [Rhizosphaericola mali]QES87877.1 methyltransferase domain-containing protein [Rhizosphaericola mali]
MPWNPEKYNQFKNIRFQPFFDLSELIQSDGLKTAVDLGCGTGEQTKILSEKFENTQFIGIDASAEMLVKSKNLESDNLHFKQKMTEDFIQEGNKFDLIFSNAALQWSDNHGKLFPQLLNLVNINGQFAVQMPMQGDNILNQLLLLLADEEPFKTYLKGWRRDYPLLSIDHYTNILFEAGLERINVMQKVYPIIANDVETLFEFISGSALIPYCERLSEMQRKEFTKAFKDKIVQAFPKFPAIYAFKRILMYGRKS